MRLCKFSYMSVLDMLYPPVFKDCYRSKHLLKEQSQLLLLKDFTIWSTFGPYFPTAPFCTTHSVCQLNHLPFLDLLVQCFSNSNMHVSHLEILLKYIFLLSWSWVESALEMSSQVKVRYKSSHHTLSSQMFRLLHVVHLLHFLFSLSHCLDVILLCGPLCVCPFTGWMSLFHLRLRESFVYLTSFSWSFTFTFVCLVNDLLNFEDYLLLISPISSMVSGPQYIYHKYVL